VLMHEAHRRPPGTLRVIGVAMAAGGRAVDLALIETDGHAHIRLIETERAPLPAGPIPAATLEIVRTFLGDRALQPSAIDFLALHEEVFGVTAVGLARGVDADVILTILSPFRRPESASRAELSAFAAVDLYLKRQVH
jgi:hypothetical protein